MDAIHNIVRLLHATAGAVALLSMLGPMIAKKGGRAHRLWGRAYVGGMGFAVVFAWVASGLRLARGEGPDGPLFLMMVGLLAGVATWSGWRVRAEKGRTGPHTDPLDRGIMGVLAGIGGLGVLYGLVSGNPLFVAFGGLSILFGGGELRSMAAMPTSRWDWWYRHMSSMLVACISTVTAFLVVNVSAFPEGLRTALPPVLWWLLPTLVGVPGMIMWTRSWKAKLEPTPPP